MRLGAPLLALALFTIVSLSAPSASAAYVWVGCDFHDEQNGLPTHCGPELHNFPCSGTFIVAGSGSYGVGVCAGPDPLVCDSQPTGCVSAGTGQCKSSNAADEPLPDVWARAEVALDLPSGGNEGVVARAGCNGTGVNGVVLGDEDSEQGG